jgi:hypothetical protein
MLTTLQLLDLLDAGEREAVVQQLLQYGKKFYEHVYTGSAGQLTRRMWVMYSGAEWHLEFVDGCIIQVELK